jgi:transglutaminase-like putative cysteine protease
MIRRLWSEQVRVTFWAWIATLGAAAMLAPLTTSKRYLLLGGFGAALVSITGALLRARRAHLVVVALLELVVAFEWIILVFARSETVFGFIPGPDAVGELRDRWASYGDVANQYAAPLPEHPDVTMAMAIVLVGLGIVVDVVAVSWRRASLLGLLFLAVYMTPVSILGGEISIIAFLFGALGYIFLLAADERERLTHWGRQISTAGSLWDRPNEVDEGGLRRNGTRIGLSAIALAAVLPVLIPTLSPHYFGQSGSGGPSGSGGDGVSVDESPALDLRRNLFDPSDQPLMQVTTTDGIPEYFGLAAMDEFDGDSWTVGERSEERSTSTEQAVPVPIGIEVSTTTLPVSYQVAIDESFDTSWLPLRYYPTDIEIDPPWRVDEDHLDAYTDSDESAAGLSYNFTADLPLPTERQLRQASEPSAEYGEYVELPADLPEVFRTEAERVTDGARTTFDKARALEAYFHDSGEFDYSLNASEVGGTGLDDLEDFLTESKVGYCEQFATSMAIMLRSLNIPTRVVVGFLQPEQVDEDTWEFLGTDMHAWPEVYFPGAGWTRFEPTPNTLDHFEHARPPRPRRPGVRGGRHRPQQRVRRQLDAAVDRAAEPDRPRLHRQPASHGSELRAAAPMGAGPRCGWCGRGGVGRASRPGDRPPDGLAHGCDPTGNRKDSPGAVARRPGRQRHDRVRAEPARLGDRAGTIRPHDPQPGGSAQRC